MATPISELPDFLTVEEAARVLRIGRTAAYALARTWRDTNGRDGLPVVTFGRVLRVPRAALERMSAGSIMASPQIASNAPVVEPTPDAQRQPSDATPRPRRHSRTASDQPALPLA